MSLEKKKAVKYGCLQPSPVKSCEAEVSKKKMQACTFAKLFRHSSFFFLFFLVRVCVYVLLDATKKCTHDSFMQTPGRYNNETEEKDFFFL